MTHEPTSTKSTGDDGLTQPSQPLRENQNSTKPLAKPTDRYRRLYEQAPLGYQSLDDAGCFIEVNQAFLDVLGYTRQEVIGHWFGDFLAPEMVDAFRERFPKFKEIGTTRVDFLMKHKNGSLRMMTIDGRVDYDEDGLFKQTHCVLQDITERKQAEDALRESEAKFRTLFEQMAQGAFYQQPDGSYDDVNPAALAMFGLTREQFIGMKAADHDWKVITPDGTVMDEEQYPSNVAIRTGKPVANILAGIYRPDLADYVWLNISAIPQFKPGQDKPYRAFVTLHDVTRQKKAEEELRASEQRFRSILEKVQLIAVELDTQGHIVFCNDYLLKLTGWTMDEVLGKDWFDEFLSNDTRSSIKELFSRTIKEKEFPVTHENPIQTHDGQLRYIRWNNVLMLNRQGQPSGIVSLGEDITESKRAETDLIRIHSLLNDAQAIAGIGGWEYEVATGKITWTKQVYDIHGVGDDYDPDNLANDIRFFSTESSAILWTAFDRAIKTGAPYDLELELFPANGGRLWVRTTARAVFQDGKVTRLLGYIQDITSRKQAEEQYQTLFREMLEGFALHEILCDDQGQPVDYRFLDVNPAFERMTGLRRSNLVGKTVREVLPGTEDHWIETYGRVATTGEPIHFDNVSRELGRHFEVAAFRPAPNQFACIFTDVTERKQIEQQINEQLAELRRWQAVTLGREDRVLSLKREVNQLLAESGRPPRYASVENEKQSD